MPSDTDPPLPDAGWRQVAERLPEFAILRELGRGSMGVVYEATQRENQRRVALKVLWLDRGSSANALLRFRREAGLLKRLRHPSIPAAVQFGERGELAFIAMEFVDGLSAADRVALGPVPAVQAAEIGIATAHALQSAHERGVLHRDVKPDNVLLRDDGGVAVTDFGLARDAGAGTQTESGSIVGTPVYMAPEQIDAGRGKVDVRSDVYALGATLYELLTARPPFSASTTQGVLKAVLDRPPTPPRRLRHDIPTPLQTVVCKALEKHPHRRYGTAQDLADDLQRFVDGERIHARPPNIARRAGQAAARRPVESVLLVAVLVLSVIGGLLWQQRSADAVRGYIQEAENKIALADGTRGARLQPLSTEARRAYLEVAVETASKAIDAAPGEPLGWFVRAQAHHRQRAFDRALADLDAAERCYGEPTAAVLYFRIDTLRQLGGSEAHGRMLRDLERLLELAPTQETRSLVAEALVDLAETDAERREEILGHAQEVIDGIETPDARTAVAHVRLLALRGQLDRAREQLASARGKFDGDPLVHRCAASIFKRLGENEQAAEATRIAGILDPLAAPVAADDLGVSVPSEPVDIGQLRSFFEQLDLLTNAIRER